MKGAPPPRFALPRWGLPPPRFALPRSPPPARLTPPPPAAPSVRLPGPARRPWRRLRRPALPGAPPAHCPWRGRGPICPSVSVAGVVAEAAAPVRVRWAHADAGATGCSAQRSKLSCAAGLGLLPRSGCAAPACGAAAIRRPGFVGGPLRGPAPRPAGASPVRPPAPLW